MPDLFTVAERGEHVVYHLAAPTPGADPEADLISVYIGVTSDLSTRLRAHRRKPWWPFVDPALCEFSRHTTRAEAEQHEAAMIGWYQPQMNVVGVR